MSDTEGYKPNLLVVDDHPENLKILIAMLTERGYRVRPAVNGKAALRAVKKMLPDLILLDIQMPGMNGFEVCRRLKTDPHVRDVPVIFISVLEDIEEKVKAFAAGAVDYIPKPLQLEEVLVRVETHLALRSMQKQLEEKNIRLEQEIAERERVEKTLRESEERYRTVVESSHSGVLILNDTYQFIYVNDQLCRILGYAREQIVGQDFREFLSGASRRMVAQYYARRLRGEDVPSRYEFEIVRRDGESRYVEARAALIRDSAGRRRTVAQLLDITERKRSEVALHRYADALEQRNEELDAFAYTVAHDLKGGLSPIIGYAETLAQNRARLSDAELGRHLTTIAQSARKLDNIVDELLLLSTVREADVELRRLDMAALVQGALDRLNELAASYGAQIECPEAWPEAVGYGPWIEEVWVNYISNAIKYGGRPPRVWLGASRDKDGAVRFWVRDNGAGLAPEEQSRLFAPFTRLAQVQTEGHGLGLSIVRRIVDRLGGQVGVESATGRGSLFWFTLGNHKATLS